MVENQFSIDDLTDEFIQTDEQAFNGLFCECGHLLSIHCAGKCYSFNYDGAKYWSCACKVAKQMQLKIKIEIDADILSTETTN